MPTLHFKGKTFVQNHHLAVKYHQLVPKKELSLTDNISLHDNLIIQGDNLKALKALLPTYAGKVKCIYIDPPYNTGNENWVYNDNVNSPMLKEWLGKVVDKEDMTRHDKWLCMMMPRLKLLRELLSEDGAIFISCDDNEQHNLRGLLDEVFQPQNFIQNIIWQKKYTQSNDAKYFSDTHDFIICYAKNKIDGEVKSGFKLNLLARTEEQNERYSNPDNDPRGEWMTQPLHAKSGTDSTYTFKFSNGVEWQPPAGTFPRYSIDTLQKADIEKRIWFGIKGDAVPRMKKFLSEMKEGVTSKSIWLYDEVGSNDDAKKPLKELFNDNLFATPKPVTLIRKIIELSTNENDVVLDSFAGSGTTAHAVLELNKEDGGNRKFILVEQEDYATTITAERVRRVIKGVKSAKNENLKKGTGGTFSYFQLGDSIEMESILTGKSLPSYEELARYIFYTATGLEFSEKKIYRKINFIGETEHYELYMLYEPNIDWLKQNALTLDGVRSMPKYKGKQRLVFAPAKYVDDYTLLEHRIDFCQLPYEIYRI
ncbi:MAG: site-specific DNA-methyltransferase, partial [Verrucomicrobia bacterium]|nr:site-specific DNA-methyltransferase [Verrucomicrobiota bacterium]